MKKITSLELGVTFAGCFLGAGFISGQEIFQFFGSFGIGGFWGLLLALFVMAAFGILLVELSRLTGIVEMDRIVVGDRWAPMRATVAGVAVFLLAGIHVIMTAGAASLLHRVFGLPQLLGAAAFCLLVTVVAFAGLQGMVKLFSAAVPALTVMAILIAAWTMARWGLQGMDLTPKDSGNPLLATWWISGLTFVSYNLFCALGAITPAGRLVPDRKTSVRGIAIGCLLMSAIAGSIQISMAIRPEVTVVDLPMLDLAYMLWPPLGILFAVLLLCGIFGTSLSSVVSVASFLQAKNPAFRDKLTILALGLQALLGSQVGFAPLISVVYPLCGYFGLLAMALMFLHYRRVTKK
jgi:uncharacterized membrane protein YkvI